MRRAAWRSKLKSPWVPPSRPTLTMRPLTLVGLEILVGDLARNLIDDQVDAFAIRGLQHLIDPAGIGGIHREVGAELLQALRGASHRSMSRSRFGALELCDLHRHQADAGTGALDQHGLARLQRAVGDDRIVHGRERDG